MSNIERHRQAHEAFNRRDWDGLVAMFADVFAYTDQPRGITVKDVQEVVGWLKEWTATLSDARVTEPTYYDAGHTTVAVFTGTGTNDGPIGPFPASNQRLSWPLCEVLTWNEEGKGVEGQIFYDQMTMLVQAGHVDPLPQP